MTEHKTIFEQILAGLQITNENIIELHAKVDHLLEVVEPTPEPADVGEQKSGNTKKK